jgi:hypothetical protein
MQPPRVDYDVVGHPYDCYCVPEELSYEEAKIWVKGFDSGYRKALKNSEKRIKAAEERSRFRIDWDMVYFTISALSIGIILGCLIPATIKFLLVGN